MTTPKQLKPISIPPLCPRCSYAMTNAYDEITGQVSKYLWQCNRKKCGLKAQLSIG